MQKVAIFGGLGYVGGSLLEHLPGPTSAVVFDSGYFINCLLSGCRPPERKARSVILKDVRDVILDDLQGIDHVIYLSALSNDPIGQEFDSITQDINAVQAVRIADLAKRCGVKTFAFASSASVYGAGSSSPRCEDDETMPLTSYARSKIEAEHLLSPLAGDDFYITCLRFTTACGFSPRLRLDLVLNDFVASALVSGTVSVLSDGSPWRPLISVDDMSRALWWAASDRRASKGSSFEVINVGCDEWNFQVKDLAHAVAEAIPGTRVQINADAPVDKRSYRVDFSKLGELEPSIVPQTSLREVIDALVQGLTTTPEMNTDYRSSEFMRLNTLRRLRMAGSLGEDLRWT